MSDLFEEDDDQLEEKEAGKSSEFAKLLEDSFRKTRQSLSVGEKIIGEILSLGKDDVFVSTGTMHDGLVPRKDLLDSEGKLNFKVGDSIDLYVTSIRGSEIHLSPKRVSKNRVTREAGGYREGSHSKSSKASEDLPAAIEDAFDLMLPIEGRVTEICKGGFRVLISGRSAFCPISQIDLKRVDVPEDYIGKSFEFKIIQLTEGGRNIVVSRRNLLDEQKGESEAAFKEAYRVGTVVPGIVTRIEKFGAFVELIPGTEGLVHISELAWSRVADPQEVVQVGQQVSVKILSFEDQENRLKISLSIKQAQPEPWKNLPVELKPGHVLEGRVTRCLKFGAFVEILPGIEGLLPLSEMSTTKRVVRSDEVVKEGDRVTVLIKEWSVSDKKILLSLDADRGDWKEFTPEKLGSFGTLGDQFRQAADKKKKSSETL